MDDSHDSADTDAIIEELSARSSKLPCRSGIWALTWS
jgi:hypothetical protein